MEQTSIFDVEDSEGRKVVSKKLKVVQADFVEAYETDWQDLFNGFDELYAITYSSGIDFINEVISQYEHSEVIFGYDQLVSGDIAAIMAAETETIKRICRHESAKNMAELMDQEKLKLFVSRDIKSHQKIYILKGKDEKYRVITGSANFSYTAFHGVQRENITVIDGYQAYMTYKKYFDEFKEECSDNVTDKLLDRQIVDDNYIDDNIEEIPIIKTVNAQSVVVVEPTQAEDDEDIVFVQNVKGLENDLRPMLPKPSKSNNGKILLTGEIIRSLKRKYDDNKEVKKAKLKKFPKLRADYGEGKLFFNSKELNLSPETDKISSDVDSIISYIDSFKVFNRRPEIAQKDYFRFMNWYLCSIFMPYLRLIASKNGYNMDPFPVYGIIYGSSNGGKSTFIKLLIKLMTGKNIPLNSSNDFTSTNIEGLKRGCEGLPINIDDLAKLQFDNHNEKIIKDDTWGINEGFINYPAVAITTNKLPSIKSDISKRTVICHIDSVIDKEKGAKNGKVINDSLKKISNAFYCEYFKRMLPKVQDMADSMKEADTHYFPDIFKISSDTIIEIIKEVHTNELPEYIVPLTWNSYFGAKTIAKNAIEKITIAYQSEPKQFKVDKKNDKLIYSIPEGAGSYQLQYIADELPPRLNCEVASRTLTMNLKEAKEFFGINFKRRRLF